MNIVIEGTADAEPVGSIMIGPRVRTALATVPIAVALVALLAIGVLRPSLIDPGPGLPVYRWAIALTGTATVLAMALAASRGEGGMRLSWCLVGGSVALWTLTVFGGLCGWDQTLVWVVLRGGSAVLGSACLFTIPGVKRALREWGLVMLDGWLVGGSVFLIGWVALECTGSLLTSAAERPTVYWVGVDLLFASVTAGLAMRTQRAVRLPVALMVLASLLAVTGDTTWALTGLPQFPVVQWLIMMLAMGTAATSRRLELWQRPPPLPPSEPRLTTSPPGLLRWSQVAVVPGLVAAVASPADTVVIIVAISVILGMAVEIALIARRNQELWHILHTQARRLDQVVSDSRDAILQLDAYGVVEFANDAVGDVLGHPARSLLGHDLSGVVHPEDYPTMRAQVAELDAGDRTAVRVNGRIRRADGSLRSLEATVSRRTGEVRGLTVLARDVSDQMLLASELRRLANTDTLTGLSNRHGFLTQVNDRLAAGEAAVLFVDLDGFKAVNDVLGHAAGDLLLVEMADALRAELGPQDVAARLGGDEFAVLTASPGRTEADALAARIADRLRRLPSDTARRTSASIGVAIGRGGCAEDLLGDADLAMYEAKAAGGGRSAGFEPEMRRRVTERARLSAALEQACDGDGLRLDVQPIVAMTHGGWVGFEALVRWQDGAHVRPPESFLPLAEETGLIVPLGEWVLRTALAWLGSWPDPAAGVSVNVAARQVAAPGFGDLVTSTLAESGIEPHRLTLEITEQTAVEDIQRAGAVLQPLRALGVHVSLDDFGTGFSSLGYLAQLPVDELKIDRRFVAGLGLRAQDDALVRAVMSLATDLGLRTVAEGVETAEQVRRLAARGCPLGQGYRFRRPTPAARLRPPIGPVIGPADAPAPSGRRHPPSQPAGNSDLTDGALPMSR